MYVVVVSALASEGVCWVPEQNGKLLEPERTERASPPVTHFTDEEPEAQSRQNKRYPTAAWGFFWQITLLLPCLPPGRQGETGGGGGVTTKARHGVSLLPQAYNLNEGVKYTQGVTTDTEQEKECACAKWSGHHKGLGTVNQGSFLAWSQSFLFSCSAKWPGDVHSCKTTWITTSFYLEALWHHWPYFLWGKQVAPLTVSW